MATRPGQRRTARLLMLVGGVTALIASGVAARWWIVWPERVREQLATLVAAGEFEKANRLLASGAEWRETRTAPIAERPPRITLYDGAGETLELSLDEWQELFTGQHFTARARTSADYLHARQILEERVPGRHQIGFFSRRPKRLMLTIERGVVSVQLVDDPRPPTIYLNERM